ncbi:hypothetical protein BD413DRAFT_157119 [Trametes elegans]|nr:hypothetical protein BD413DRAFT_157119 [Trametes elegans]
MVCTRDEMSKYSRHTILRVKALASCSCHAAVTTDVHALQSWRIVVSHYCHNEQIDNPEHLIRQFCVHRTGRIVAFSRTDAGLRRNGLLLSLLSYRSLRYSTQGVGATRNLQGLCGSVSSCSMSDTSVPSLFINIEWIHRVSSRDPTLRSNTHIRYVENHSDYPEPHDTRNIKANVGTDLVSKGTQARNGLRTSMLANQPLLRQLSYHKTSEDTLVLMRRSSALVQPARVGSGKSLSGHPSALVTSSSQEMAA